MTAFIVFTCDAIVDGVLPVGKCGRRIWWKRTAEDDGDAYSHAEDFGWSIRADTEYCPTHHNYEPPPRIDIGPLATVTPLKPRRR